MQADSIVYRVQKDSARILLNRVHSNTSKSVFVCTAIEGRHFKCYIVSSDVIILNILRKLSSLDIIETQTINARNVSLSDLPQIDFPQTTLPPDACHISATRASN